MTHLESDSQSIPAFEDLAMPFFESLHNFAYWLAPNRNDAEDLVQETYLKALRSFTSFQPETNFRAWMFKILKNTFLSSRSTLAYRMTDPLEHDSDYSPDSGSACVTPESITLARSSNEAIRAAIANLPLIYREVILLCDVEDVSYREMADILSIPIGTVMSRVARARKLVRDSIDNTWETSACESAQHGQGSRKEASKRDLNSENRQHRNLSQR